MKGFLVFHLFLVQFQRSQGFSTSDCDSYDSHMGAIFSLSELKRTADQLPYIIEDGDIPCTYRVEQNFTYYFNICGTIASGIPKSCKDSKEVSQRLSTAAALQVNDRNTEHDQTDDWCYLVGSFTNDKTSMGLINPSDPTEGIRLTYTGSRCGNNKDRIFNILLTCADKLNPTPLHALEYSVCEYTITVPSVYGCPVECPVSKRSLCGGAGYCAYDLDAQKARCFCNKGYSGSDCSQTTSSASSSSLNYSPALLGLSITLFIIIAILVIGLVLMFRQMMAYKEDMSNYQVLKGDEDGRGTSVTL